jgi:hypothetical protein
VHPHKHAVYWAGYDPDCRPKSAEALAAARAKRQEKAVGKEAAGSLFSDLIREEGYVPKGRKR